MGCQRHEIALDLVRDLDLLQRLLRRLQQARIVDCNCGVRGNHRQDRQIAIGEAAFFLVDRLQHAHHPFLDGHWYAKQ